MASHFLDNFRKAAHLGVMRVRGLFIHKLVSTEAYNHWKHLTFQSGFFMTVLPQCFLIIFPKNPRVQSIHSWMKEGCPYILLLSTRVFFLCSLLLRIEIEFSSQIYSSRTVWCAQSLAQFPVSISNLSGLVWLNRAGILSHSSGAVHDTLN